MQGAYFLSDLEGCVFDFEACSQCNHHYVLPVGLDIAEILKSNEKFRQVQTTELSKWNKLSSSRRP